VSTALGRPASLAGAKDPFWQLSLIQIRRYLRHPLYLAGVTPLVGALIVTAVRPNVPLLTWDSPLTFELYLGLAGIVVGHTLAVAEDQAEEVFAITPVDRRTRTLALYAACLVPAITAVLLMAAARLVTPGIPEYQAAALRPSTGLISPMEYTAWLLALGPVACFGGAALGVLVGRRVRFAGAGLATALVLFMVELVAIGAASVIPGPGDTWWARIPASVMPYGYWLAAEDNLADGVLAMRPGSPTGHLVYAVSLCALAVVAGVLHRATPTVRESWLRVGSLFAVLATVGWLWGLLG
jgi:hypothetical protein